MRSVDKVLAGIGMVIAGCLTWSAYYSNLHPGATRINEMVYLVLFPPSLGLMATEKASVFEQVTITIFLICANGALYGLASAALRKLLEHSGSN